MISCPYASELESSTAPPRTVALTDAHSDLSGTFAAAGTALASSVTWDPWGQVLASTGPGVQVGYQGQWTDPLTAQVSMGSRFYRPGTGGFSNKDTYAGARGGAAVTGNAYAYADDNPLTLTDSSGHAPSKASGSGAGITRGQVTAAYARAAAAGARAAKATAQAGLAKLNATRLSAQAWGAKHLADLANTAARTAEQAATAAAFAAAQQMLAQADYWRHQAAAALDQARHDLWQSVNEPWYDSWKIPEDLAHAAAAGADAAEDGSKAAYYYGRYLADQAAGYAWDLVADGARKLAAFLASKARGLDADAARWSAQAAADNSRASQLWSQARADAAHRPARTPMRVTTWPPSTPGSKPAKPGRLPNAWPRRSATASPPPPRSAMPSLPLIPRTGSPSTPRSSSRWA